MREFANRLRFFASPGMTSLAVLAAMLLVGMVARAQTPAQTAPPKVEAPVEDPAVTALARKIYAQIRAGKVDETLLTAAINKQFSPEVLAQFKPVFDQLGDPAKLTLERSEKTGAGTRWIYLATFAAAQLHVTILVTADGKVGGYALDL